MFVQLRLKYEKSKTVLSFLSFSHHFEVKTKYDANNLAYTSNFLPLHIDLPYYDYIPGVGGNLLIEDLEQCLFPLKQKGSKGDANGTSQ